MNAFQDALLSHYYAHKRDLPWRANSDPYAVWVSEIMLQQTQTSAVIPYFKRFMAQFPTIQDLANADMQEVLKVWEGMGYYRRAHNLHIAAKYLVNELNGSIPKDAAKLRKLPGIGLYTAGAISSIAFGEHEPLVDGNVQRCLSRIFEIYGDVSKGEANKTIWLTAKEILSKEKPGDFNQALMELGATICLPAEPLCHRCPVNSFCKAYEKGLQLELPQLPPGKKNIKQHHVCVVMKKENSVFIVKRTSESVWSDLWEFPHTIMLPDETTVEAANRIALELVNIPRHNLIPLAAIKHQVMHFSITLHAFVTDINGVETIQAEKGEWKDISRLGDIPMSAPQRKVADSITSVINQPV